MAEVFFEVLSPMPLNRRQDALDLFRLRSEKAPGFFPDRGGVTEPLRRKITVESIHEALDEWWFHFIAKRVAQPRVESNIFMQYGPHRKHSSWTICVQDHLRFQPAPFEELIRASAEKFDVDFGFIHIPNTQDLEWGRKNGTARSSDRAGKRKNLFVTTFDLLKYLPNLYWMTVFGAPYVRLFSRGRLLAAPAHKVIELGNGSILVQLTPSVTDCIKNEAIFEQRRAEVRDFLGRDAFFDANETPSHLYRTPEFVWRPILH